MDRCGINNSGAGKEQAVAPSSRRRIQPSCTTSGARRPPGKAFAGAMPVEPIEHVCFIENGLASMVAESTDGRSIEIRHIGFEGVAGYPVVLGVDHTPNKTFMQVSGEGTADSLPMISFRFWRISSTPTVATLRSHL
jgi:hypothetical protein